MDQAKGYIVANSLENTHTWQMIAYEARCAPCLKALRAKRAERVSKKDRKARQAEYSRNKVAERIDAGLCARCGKVPPRPGSASCARCAEIIANTAKQRRVTRAAAGLCTSCGSRSPREGRKECEECATTKSANKRRRTESKKIIAADRAARGLAERQSNPKRARAPGNRSQPAPPKRNPVRRRR